MAISTTYSPLESAATALATAIGLSWPTLTGTATGESQADMDAATVLLETAVTERDRYAARALRYNQNEAAATAASAAYDAAVIAHDAAMIAGFAEIDASIRAAEQELLDVAATGTWAPGTPTTPTNDIPAVVNRARVASWACRRHQTLVPLADALANAALNLELHYLNPPQLADTPAAILPTAPTTTVSALEAFIDYLAAS